MVFTTYLFVFYFLPIVLAVYYALFCSTWQAGKSDGEPPVCSTLFLVLASYVFYGWWNPWFIFLMLGVTVVNYVCGRIIGLPGISQRLSSWVVTLAIVISLGTLGFFKYFLFFEAKPERGAGRGPVPDGASARDHLAHRDLVLHFPCAQLYHRRLSRYGASRPVVPRFRLLHRVVSTARRRAYHPLQHGGRSASAAPTPGKSSPPGAHPVHPRLRQKDLAGQSDGPGCGCRVRLPVAGRADAWFGVLAYAFQIYFDFSGYSDMAIGLGRMIGFDSEEFRFAVPGREHHGLLECAGIYR